ncbi:hypothetical protein [uncultured Dokdonia sp.]|uniref:hypothetical protein n=1 Tax=uncultured Dokdonia sp. TaxID=575653 RepID=UPI002618287E|nr:hypothetical protein [uncultured Dokdonia sp.]
MKPFDYKWSRFYKSNTNFPYAGLELYLKENELIICSTVIDDANYSILTTQKLITKENGVETIGNLMNAIQKNPGDFKGYRGDPFTLGLLQLEDGNELKYFIETGKASMIMIHGIRTLLQTQKMTIKNVENVTRVWNKKNKQNEK